MPATGSRVARLRTAERAGGTKPSEDRLFSAAHAVIVLDGASQPAPSPRNGGWLAEVLGSRLRDGLTASPTRNLVGLLRTTIHEVAVEFSLVPGQAPSSTVSIVRWDSDEVDTLVLGDSPVVALTTEQTAVSVRDDRLSSVAAAERQAFRAGKPGTFGQQKPREWRALVEVQRRARNTDGGYWIAEAVPEAADQAISRRSQSSTWPPSWP